jgi:uncharacterized iron-regulated protein
MDRSLDPELIFKVPQAPRELRMFSGRDRQRLTWDQVMEAALWAEVILVSEKADDRVAHQVELALVQDSLERWPWTVLSLEMLKRDDQQVVDSYSAGNITQETFIQTTHAADWSGQAEWLRDYQPLIEAAKAKGAPILAPSAPRSMVELARTQGYAPLRKLPKEQKDLVAVPAKAKPSPEELAAFGEAVGITTDEELEGLYRASVVQNSTIARSIVDALDSRNPRVIHVGTHYNIDFDGNLVKEIRSLRPTTKILTLTLQPRTDDNLLTEDLGRADIVVYSIEGR